MKGIVLRRGVDLAPFGTPVGESCVLGGTLRQSQVRALAAIGLGCEEVDCSPDAASGAAALVGPALLLDEEQFVSPGALRAFWRQVQRQPSRAAALGLVAGAVTDWCRGPGEVVAPEDGLVRQGVRYLPAGRSLGQLAAGDPLPLLRVEPGGQQVSFPAPRGSRLPDLVIPTPARLALPIVGWTQLLLANLLGFSAGVQEPGPFRTSLRVLGAVLRARSLNPYAIAGKLNQVGRGCLIHPAAVVEGCSLGEGVRIGAGSILQGCVLGDGVIVEELASAALSVFGPGAVLQRHAIARFSTVFPEAEVAGGIQLSVLGRGASLKHASYTLDMPLDGQPIRVLHEGRLQPAGLPLLGACLGHRALVGSGVWLAPGRVIPNDLVVIQDPTRVVRQVPAALEPGVPAWVEDGHLVQRRPGG